VQPAAPRTTIRPVRSHRIRWAVTAAAILPAALLAAGCGSGPHNETSQEQSAVQAAHVTSGSIQIEDIYVTPVGTPLNPGPDNTLAEADTTVSPSPQPTPSLPAKGQADGYLVATVVNNAATPDAVTGVTIGSSSTTSDTSPSPGSSAAESGTVTLAPSGADTTVRPYSVLNFLDPADYNSGQSGPYLVLVNLSSPLIIGDYLPVTFAMASGTTDVVQVPVISSDFGAPPSSPPVPITSSSPSSSAKKSGK